MKCKEALNILLKAGWEIKSQKGSHLKLIKNGFEKPIIFPNHGSKELAKGTWEKIKKDAGI